VVLDDLVLDVSQFLNLHPGGRFVIRQNIGRDVSKFFFGGYNLDGNLTGIKHGYTHSNYARLIVNDLAIAIYEKDIPTFSGFVSLSKSKSNLITPNLKNVVFET
jgi:cytochrome b involved in lipid metabolism